MRSRSFSPFGPYGREFRETMPSGLFRLFRPSLSLTSFSLSRWDTTDKHGLPRQGQYTGQSIVLSLSEIFWWKVW